MPVCVATAVGAGGAQYLILDTSKTDYENCTYVIEDGASLAWRELTNMSTQDAGQISTAIGVVWAIAWGFKQILRMVRDDSGVEN